MKLPHARLSPRIDNGVLYWYEGDTFTMNLELKLRDPDGEEIIIPDTATVTVVFRDESEETVKEFTFEEIEGNTVVLEFDTNCTALFPAGKYTYDVYYDGEYRTTLINENKVVVEE